MAHALDGASKNSKYNSYSYKNNNNNYKNNNNNKNNNNKKGAANIIAFM